MLQRIGGYEIVERVAVGGQGTVFRAWDTVRERTVAVKVLNQSVSDDPQYLDALQREFRLASSLNHPNVIAVYDFQVEEGTAYIVMEYVPGSLDKQFRAEQPLPYRRAVEIAIEICRGLAHAHENGVVHRDIKPQNILLTDEGTVRVSDFGIARALSSSTQVGRTLTTGTPWYMSLEQWTGSEVDGRADLYSTGIVLYEMLTGSVPFQGEAIEAIFVQHRESTVPRLPGELGVPREVEDIISRALEKSAEDRYANAADMATSLEGVLTTVAGQEAVPAQPQNRQTPAAPFPSPSRPPRIDSVSLIYRLGRKRIALGLLIATILVVLASVGGLNLLRDSSGTPLETVVEPTYTPMPEVSSYSKGLELYEIGEYQQAIDMFDAAVSSNPDDTMAYLMRGLTHHALYQYQRAIHDYDKAIQLDPGFAGTYVERGKTYLVLDQYQKAFKDYDKAIQLDPKFAAAYKNRGDTYFELGQFSKAIEDHDKAIQLDPGDAWAYELRGMAYYALGQIERAIRDYEKAIQLNPDDAAARYHLLGLFYSGLGESQRAIENYDKAIQRDPLFPDAYGHRGKAYLHLGQYQRAIEDYDKAIELQPAFAIAYLGRGNAYDELGQSRRAIEDYDKAIELDPSDASTYNYRGTAYYNLGLYERAIEDHDRAVELDPGFVVGYLDRGDAYDELGQYQRAIEDYAKAIDLDPDFSVGYQLRGDTYHLLGQSRRAIEDYDKAIQLNPDIAGAYAGRGDAYDELGQYTKGSIDEAKACSLDREFCPSAPSLKPLTSALSLYTNNIWRYGVEIPASVEVATPSPYETEFWHRLPNGSIGEMTIVVEPIEEDLSVGEYAGAELVKGQKQDFESYNLVSFTPVTIAGRSAWKATETWKRPSDGNTREGDMYFFVADGLGYSIFAEADRSRWSSIEPTFDQIVRSLTFAPPGLSSEDCLAVFDWREATQEYYFDINTRDITESTWMEETSESFFEVAKLTLPSPRSKPDSELLPLLELHTAEMEEIVFEIAASGSNALSIKEGELREANKTVRKINNLLVQECQLEPLILYEPHPQSRN